jgi:hypothetical protein
MPQRAVRESRERESSRSANAPKKRSQPIVLIASERVLDRGSSMDKKLPGIQVGRAIAALSVFHFHSYIALGYFDQSKLHTNAWLAAHGAIGVNFFFAISGFIVCYIAGRPNFEPISFLLKRFFRIYPLSAIVTLAMRLDRDEVGNCYSRSVRLLRDYQISFDHTAAQAYQLGWVDA